MKPRIVAVANQKGGVGKTTTVVNLGATLAAYEQRTVIVDLDPQSNCTSGLGVEDVASPMETSYGLIVNGSDPQNIIRPTGFPHLSIIPSVPDLAGAEAELVGMVGREFRVRDGVKKIDGYRYLLLDCPPALGQLTINALTAADGLLVPIQCEYYALEGVSELMKTIEDVRRYLNPGLAIDGIILTMYDERTNLSRQVADEVRSAFGELVFETVIPRNIRLAEAPSFGRPIHAYDLRSRGAQAYLHLGREYLDRMRTLHG